MTIKEMNVVTPSEINLVKGFKLQDGKYEVAVDNDTINIENGVLKATATGGGLDCEAIDQLPIKHWKEGTMLLAKQDGECVRLQPANNVFQDVGVAMRSDKDTVESDGSTVTTVTTTVTNSGLHKANKVTLIMTKPQLGNYTLENVRFTSQGAGLVTKINNLKFTIEELEKGGTVQVKFDIKSTTEDETYQFSSMVTYTGIDTDTRNNTDTIIINSINSNPDSNYIPSEDCPLVKAYYINEEKGTEESLQVYSDIWNIPFQKQGEYLNVVNTENSLQGHKIKLEGASTVIAVSNNDSIYNYSDSYSASNSYSSSKSSSYSDSDNSSTNSFSESKKLIVGDIRNWLAEFKNNVLQKEDDGKWHTTPENTPSLSSMIINAGTFDPDTQIFTFHKDFAKANPDFKNKDIIYQRAITLWVRPAGNNCRWQCINLIPTRIDPSLFLPLKTFTFNNVNKVLGAENITVDLGQAGYPKEYRFSKLKAQGLIPQGAYHRTGEQCNWVGKDKPTDLDAFVYNNGDPGTFVYARSQGTQNPKLEVTVKKGKKCQLTFEYWNNKTSSQNIPLAYQTTGKTSVQINPSNPKQGIITVSADAQPTDSVNFSNLKVTIVD